MLLDTNFLILDEPTNHLDLKTKDIFQDALINYHGTVAIVSHDRYFLDNLVNKVFELKDGEINYYLGNYSYFIEKRNQTISSVINKNTSQLLPENQASRNKGKKRLEAEERNKAYQKRAPLEKELSAIENKISTLEAKKSEHETALCNPQTLKDSLKIKRINLELKNINADLEGYYKTWTEINAKLDEL